MTTYERYTNALPLGQFYILVCLAWRPLHAYALQQQVTHDSLGSVVLPNPTLKRALESLCFFGFIAPAEDHLVARTDSRRGTTYVITSNGRRRLKREAERYDRAAQLADAHLQRHEQRQNPATT